MNLQLPGVGGCRGLSQVLQVIKFDRCGQMLLIADSVETIFSD